MSDSPPSMSPQDALVAVMIAVSASDEQLRTAELVAIQRIVNHAPIFAGYDSDRIRQISQTGCSRSSAGGGRIDPSVAFLLLSNLFLLYLFAKNPFLLLR